MTPKRVRQIAKRTDNYTDDRSKITKAKPTPIIPRVIIEPKSVLVIRARLDQPVKSLDRVKIQTFLTGQSGDPDIEFPSLFNDYIPKNYRIGHITVYSPRNLMAMPSGQVNEVFVDLEISFYGLWTRNDENPSY